MPKLILTLAKYQKVCLSWVSLTLSWLTIMETFPSVALTLGENHLPDSLPHQNTPEIAQMMPSFPYNARGIVSTGYAVFVNGDSPFLLNVIRSIQPTASLASYKDRQVIFVGNFYDLSLAESWVKTLRDRGIEGSITDFQDGEFLTLLSPVSPIAIDQGTGAFLVLVDRSRITLEQVQQIEPSAIIQAYNGTMVIQAGRFFSQEMAQQRVQQLAVQQIPSTMIREGQSFVPSVPLQSGDNSAVYLVLVNHNNVSLEQVQRVEPSAIIQTYNGTTVVQAGRFSSREMAQQRAQQLAVQQIPSTIIIESKSANTGQTFFPPITPIQPTYIPNQVSQNYGTIPSKNWGTNSQISRYWVGVKSSSGSVYQLGENMKRLGVSSELISVYNLSPEPYIFVGPFEQINLAQQWLLFLRNSGISSTQIYQNP